VDLEALDVIGDSLELLKGRSFRESQLHPHDLIATVDIDHLTGDPTRTIACEENAGLPKFFSRTAAT
jgi:hypothetical protein